MPDSLEVQDESIPVAIDSSEVLIRSIYDSINIQKKKDKTLKESIHPTALRAKTGDGLSLYRDTYTNQGFCIAHSKKGDNVAAKRLFCGLLYINHNDIDTQKHTPISSFEQEYETIPGKKFAQVPLGKVEGPLVKAIEIITEYSGDTSGLLSLIATPMNENKRVPPPFPNGIPNDGSISLPMHAEIFYLYETPQEPGEPRTAIVTAIARRLLDNAVYTPV